MTKATGIAATTQLAKLHGRSTSTQVRQPQTQQQQKQLHRPKKPLQVRLQPFDPKWCHNFGPTTDSV
jgi:hypothetical protein